MNPHLASLTACLLPRKLPKVCDWLEQNLSLPAEMAPKSPGRLSFSRRRFQRPILECWHPDSGTHNVTVAAATQTMKTTGGQLGLAYRMLHRPWPAIIMGKSYRWTEAEIGKARLRPLIDNNPILAALKPHDLDLYTLALMSMRSGTIKLVGADSPIQLAGMSAGIVIAEEAAKIQRAESEETPDAHPLLNVFERTKDFRDTSYFHYASSSPTSPTHPFWHMVEGGTMEHFHVECPHCHEWFPLDMPAPDELTDYFTLIGKTAPKEYRSVTWSDAARDKSGDWSKQAVEETAHYICPHNGCQIKETARLDMLDTATPKTSNRFATTDHRSFIVPSLYGPSIHFATMALKFLEASSTLFGMEAFRNSWLAKTWELIKKNIKEEIVLRCKSTHQRRTIPSRPKLLGMAVDPGGDRKGTKWGVAAIMPDASIVVIDWGTVGNVKELLRPDFLRSLRYPLSGTDEFLTPQLGYCDARFDTSDVYAVCLASRGFFTPTMGGHNQAGAWWESTPTALHGHTQLGYSDFQMKFAFYVGMIADRTGPAFILPDDPYTGTATGINTAATDDPDSFAALVAGLSGQKLIETNGRRSFKSLPDDDYGDVFKLIKLMSEVGSTLMLSRLTPTTGRDYELKRQ